MELLIQLLVGVTAISVGIQLLGLCCLLRFYFRKPPPLNRSRSSFPGVTLIKPCHANQDNEIENFDAFFNQDYPGPMELLFVVSTETAPIVPIVRQYLEKYPKVDARLIVSNTRKAYWKKVDALYDGHQEAKYDFILWSDSDAIVKQEYVSQMVASLEEPGVSVVTTPQCDTRINNFASAFKVPGNTCDLATFVMIADFFSSNRQFGWGHSMGFRKHEFDSFPEAWGIMNTFLADDQALPYIFAKRGRQVVFRNIYCPVEYSNKTLKEVISQKKRWVWTQRIAIGSRYLYLLALAVYPQIPAAAVVLLSGFSVWSLKLFFAAAFVRVGIFLIHEILFLNSIRMSLRWFWTIVLWDLSQVYFILNGFSKFTIDFEGKTYRVVNRYFLERVVSSKT